ncbi:LOW QUALITY PROTEIN: ATG22 Autophagy-related protein 22 [Candida maltosa Xu316]
MKKDNDSIDSSIAKDNVLVDVVDENQQSAEGSDVQSVSSEEHNRSIWGKKSIFYTWLLLCYSTGPVASMSRTYVPASIQSIARSVGKTSTGGVCANRGNDCFVEFGVGKVHYTSYVLYLRAIATAVDGIVAIFLMGIADYSNFRKMFLIVSILLYGCFAVPFVGLTGKNYPTLKAASALYALMSIDDSIYQILEGSYIPLAEKKQDQMKRGSVVSVLGLVLSNVGGLTALVVGIIISYTSGRPDTKGYYNFLLAITIAGCMTIVMAVISSFYIPSVKGKKRDENVLVLPFKRFFVLLKDIQKYPMAFLYCVSWVIWNVSFSNFMNMFLLLFRSTLGLGNSDAEYTVYTFMSYICGSLGSLAWMFLYPKCKFNIKYWGYMFLAFSAFTNFWGCLGIHERTSVGFQHRWEFWVFEVFYAGTSSAMRSLNRCVYSSLLPEGDEAQYFGLEIMLGIATGWIGSLVNAVIQDRTHDDRFPFLPNLFLVLIALALYYKVDLEKGMEDVNKKKDPEPELLK